MVTSSKSADDWADAALDAFADGGVRNASIPSIARSLGVTKGSFYWHFHSFDELVERALKRWEERDRAVLDELQKRADPRERLAALFAEAMHSPQAQALFVAFSGSSIASVSAAIRRLSDRRIDFLIDAYGELGFDAKEARNRAVLVYSAYAGLLLLRSEKSPWLRTARDVDAVVEHATATLVPPRAARRNKQ